MKYEPYKTDSFLKLLQKAINLGFYSGRLDILNIIVQGEFEGFSGRASETWESHFIVKWNASSHLETDGSTLEEACKKMVDKLGDNS